MNVMQSIACNLCYKLINVTRILYQWENFYSSAFTIRNPLQCTPNTNNLKTFFSGIPQEEGRKKIWLKDSKGLVVQGRPEGGISEHKAPFAHPHETMKELNLIVKELKPSVLIGAAAQGK